MDSPTLILTDLPELSDESAGQLLDFLYLFLNEFENRYRNQLQRYYQSLAVTDPLEPPEDDLFEGFDEIPF